MTDTTIDDGTIDKDGGGAAGASPTDASLKRSLDGYGAQAADKAKAFVDMGKDRATDALGQLSQLLTDAAAQVDEKLGAQYGDYARDAAGQVSSFAERLKARDADALVDEGRAYVSKSPGVAIGVAAALGFVAARLFQSGLDAESASGGA